MTQEIPLFPLNTVLFPGTPIHLHIFEPRYREMIGRCLDDGAPFGVVLIQSGVEALGPLPRPHALGCTALIADVERLGGGRMNLVAVGGERFRILGTRRDRPYLVAEVEMLPLEAGDPADVRRAERQLRGWMGRYLDVLAAASETREDLSVARLPGDPRSLGYVAASLLPLPAHAKQDLLASTHLAELLRDVGLMYRRELPILETLIAQPGGEDEGPFSRN